MNPWTTITADELAPKHAGALIRFRPVHDDPEVVIQARLKTVSGPGEAGAIYLAVDGVQQPWTFNGGWQVPPGSDVEVRR